MKYAVEVGSDVMIYTSGLIKIILGIQQLVLGDAQTNIHTDTKVVL